MCEMFPYFGVFLCNIPLRLGLFFISIQSIMIGVTGLSVLESQTGINFNKLKDFTEIVDTMQLFTRLSKSIVFGYTLMCFASILLGVMLFYATLWDEETFIMTFVWGMLANVLSGLLVTIALGISCVIENSCLLSSMDWLSNSIIFVVLLFIIVLWLYYVCIAHSYIEDTHW